MDATSNFAHNAQPRRVRTGAEQVHRLAAALDRVSRAVRLLLVARAACLLIAGSIAGALAIALIDLGLRLPGAARGALLIAGLVGLGVASGRTLLPAWRVRPSRAALANRLEAIDPRFAGQIAPAVDLLETMDGASESGAIARAGVEEAGRRVDTIDPWRLVRWTGAGRAAAAFALALGAIAGLAAWSPSMTGIGAARVLAPWTDARWPTRYGVTDLTGVTVHPVDEALPVRVAVGPGDAGQRVRVEWRLGDERTPSRTPMTPQPGSTDSGRPYERLIDPAGLDLGDGEAFLRYRVVTPDDQTGWARVRLVRPPEVVGATALVEAPGHAADAPGIAGFRTGERDLPGPDAALGPVLEGSRVTLVWRFSKPVRPVDAEAWAAGLGVSQPDDRSVSVELAAESPVRIAPQVVDAHGLGVRGSFSVGLDVRPDGLPGVAITEPASDEIVTPDAALHAAAEAGDDVGVTGLRLDALLLRVPGGSAGAAPEPVGEPITLAASALSGPVSRAETGAAFTPSALGAAAGDEIVLAAVAHDTRAPEGEARSAERRLRVVSPDELVSRLRSELDPVSRLLRRADEQQGALNDRLRRGEEDRTGLTREQLALADTVASAVRSVRGLERSRARNALEDPALEALLRDLDAVLNEAQDAARDAARAVEAGRDGQAQEHQRTARDRIGRALSLLDRGEDAFLARRAVARLREQLGEAREQTAEIGRRTAGQDDAAMGPGDRAELDRLAAEQQALSDRAREALDELMRRAEALAQADPAQAESLRRASERGRAGAVGSLIEQAARQTGENQTGEAQRSQTEAIERLDEMLEEMDRAESLRDTALRRRLATLDASIRQLTEAQRAELAALDAAREADARPDLARPMIALRDNTLGVIEEASAALAELRLIAEALREAERAQARAVEPLRAAPPALDDAEVHERSSLAALERALAEVERQEDQAAQREQARRKAELRQAYRAALGTQSDLREGSASLLGRALSRRERLDARRLSASQRELLGTLAATREATAEISEAPIFALAHDRLDELMAAAADGLAAATPPAGVGLDQDQAVAILASLVEVLGERGSDDQDFQEGGGGGGGDGQGGQGSGQEGLIPPIAELRLLREMQRATMETTRRLAERPDSGDAADDAARTARLAAMQRLLAERGLELLEKLNQQPVPGEQTPVEPLESGDGREPSGPVGG